MKLIGYLDAWSFAPGDPVALHLDDADAPRDVRLEVVRVDGLDATGRRARVARVDGVPAATVTSRRQTDAPGAHAVCDSGLAGHLTGAFAICLLVRPTLDERAGSDLASTLTDDGAAGVALGLDDDRRATFVIGHAGGPLSLRAERPLPLDEWSWVLAGYDAGVATVCAGPYAEAADPSRASAEVPAPTAGTTELVLAGPRPFTGRLEHPTVLAGMPADAELAAWLAGERHPARLGGDRVAAWDFTRDPAGFEVPDASGHTHPLQLRNLPLRALAGARWRPGAEDWRRDPERFGAIHFARDSLEDAGWTPEAPLALPGDLASGCYAVRATAGEDEDLVPFFVRPAPEAAAAPVLLLASTATYLAYANARCWWERPMYELQLDETLVLGREDQAVLARPGLGLSSYDFHADHQQVNLVSVRRPNLNLRAGHRLGEGYTADLAVVDWLGVQGIAHDVATDHDLDAGGVDLLARYPVVVLGTHPEYVSAPMWRALDDYVSAGGRIIVMGGNALCYPVAFHPERPWVMEVRKPDLNPGIQGHPEAEGRLAFTGRPGGMTAGSDMPSGSLIGVNSVSMGFDEGRPYERTPESHDERFAFVFAGVTGEEFGRRSDRGGVVFQEWDNTSGPDVDPEQTTALARSSGHSATTVRFGSVTTPAHAEMAMTFRPGGGASFTFGSMGWALALSDPSCPEAARITANVFRRFLEPDAFIGG